VDAFFILQHFNAILLQSGAFCDLNSFNIEDWKRNGCTDQAIHDAFLFFEAQESGELSSDNRVTWRGDSYMNDHVVFNGQRKDLTGGHFDAGGTTPQATAYF
jgi:Glycosyl hydrolase family 9